MDTATEAAQTVVLVPGAGGDAWYWHRVVPLLRRAGHVPVPVDLPAADDDAGLEEYAEAVVRAVERSDHRGSGRRLTVVGQSMGGLSAPVAAARTGADTLVLVNAMVPLPGETGGEWWGAVGQPAAMREAALTDGRAPEFDPVRDFFHDVPDEVNRAAFARGEHAQSDRPFADPWPLDAWPDVPTHVVTGADDRLFPAGMQTRVARERLGLDPVVVPGGHLLALADPDTLAHLLTTLSRG